MHKLLDWEDGQNTRWLSQEHTLYGFSYFVRCGQSLLKADKQRSPTMQQKMHTETMNLCADLTDVFMILLDAVFFCFVNTSSDRMGNPRYFSTNIQ